MIKLKKMYLCDPYKNEECTKTGCKLGYCRATSNKKYAVIDPYNGRPILLPEFNLIELTIDDVFQHVIDRGREQWVKIRIDDLYGSKEE